MHWIIWGPIAIVLNIVAYYHGKHDLRTLVRPTIQQWPEHPVIEVQRSYEPEIPQYPVIEVQRSYEPEPAQHPVIEIERSYEPELANHPVIEGQRSYKPEISNQNEAKNTFASVTPFHAFNPTGAMKSTALSDTPLARPQVTDYDPIASVLPFIVLAATFLLCGSIWLVIPYPLKSHRNANFEI